MWMVHPSRLMWMAMNTSSAKPWLALEALGYSRRELKRIEKHLGKESFGSVDEAVKRGLKYLVQ